MINTVVQFIKFGIVGASNTLISLLIYYIFILVGINYLVANISGYIISSIWGYVLNKMWVFKENKCDTKVSICKYYIIYGSSLLINLLSMYILVDQLNVSEIVSPLLTLCITIPYNFILNKVWAFKDSI